LFGVVLASRNRPKLTCLFSNSRFVAANGDYHYFFDMIGAGLPANSTGCAFSPASAGNAVSGWSQGWLLHHVPLTSRNNAQMCISTFFLQKKKKKIPRSQPSGQVGQGDSSSMCYPLGLVAQQSWTLIPADGSRPQILEIIFTGGQDGRCVL
jgi:hypothetical protein